MELDFDLENILSNINKPRVTLKEIGEDVIVYGAGNTGKDLVRIIGSKIKVRCFYDAKAKEGESWNNIPVYKPDINVFTQDEKNKITIVIAIFNRDTDIAAIRNLMLRNGYPKVYSFVEVFEAFASDLGDRFWLSSVKCYYGNENQILEAFSLLSDELSRNIFQSVLQYRFTGDERVLPNPDLENQYYPEDLTFPEGPHRLVDCGSCVGDAISFLTKYVNVDSVRAFEPDLENFSALERYVDGLNLRSVELWPCGVWNTTENLSFLAAGNTSSYICESGNARIQCVALDHVLKGYDPTFIKMDIEGAEYNALIGARNLISKSRSILAISVYHCADHLWSIPLLVDSFFGDYDYYLRLHGFNGFELILYAIPKGNNDFDLR